MRSYLVSLLSTALLLFPSWGFAAERTYTIEDAYRAAISANESIKIAEESVAQSSDRIDQATTYLYPRLTAQGAYTHYNDTLPPSGGQMLFQPLDQYQASLTLTQPLYTGGRTMAALRTAQKMRESSNESLFQTRQDLLLAVAETYYSVLKAQKAVEISERSLARMEHHKEITQQEAASRRNKANQSALLRAESLVSQARIALVRSKDGLRIARNKLCLLTKLPEDMQAVEPTHLEQQSAGLDELRRIALDSRDDYKNAALNKNIAEENVTIVRGGHYPQLAAIAGVQYQDSRPDIIMDSTTYYAGLRLTIPIFEGGLMKAEVAEAHSKVRQAELSASLLRATIESDVQEAYVNLQTELSVLDTAKQQMEFAKGNYDAVEGLFSEGLAPSLSMIDAEQALTYAESELMSATYDRELAILRLKKATGLMGKES
jgi:outer membrane protein